ncbi:iron-sulfur cluster biosynthesis family protein [Thalassobacillus pellis]|uniref:iron-sulfur cluster biosynthesis family protein n=1 Tax=Thalassobacillus pellis TaxID=748008 RepID=UPI001960E920|nr:iron-sulfur cluster biosynthesis family protein [Thalassobacillus pellis]MBM7552383.1 uncharacterized protein YqkB [Thalassobacillus pellis]
MKLTITDSAKIQLESLRGEEHPYLRLFYDTDDCGCGVNGVPTVRWTSHRTEWDKSIESTDYSVIVHKQQAIFFSEKLKLDAYGGALRLSSPEGILNPAISGREIVKEEEM